MAAYAYDDYRVTFVPRPDDGYDVTAVDATGVTWRGEFRVPLSDADLAGAVQGAVAHARSVATRDVGGEARPAPDAEGVGAALADALFAGPIGEGYAAARTAASQVGHGVRLSLSLAAAPALLSVPWEFLYQRPRFLASQRQSPVVRLLDTGVATDAVVIDSAVRILGVVASPADLTPLDVAKERAGVEQAVATMRELGRVELDWLEPATPKRLRETLRDGSYHVLHYIGHSAFTDAGDGVVFLEDDDGSSRAVDETLLANLLSDQDRLRLVVLNSCEGARTTISDPYAGVATTLVSLGVPAVVAMQFEISDTAAIVFGTELYVNLIGRQTPIDAAVAEARKAVYSEVDPIEWATPVLFLRDPDVQLFDFARGGAPLPLPDPPLDTAEHEALAPPVRPRGRRRVRTALVGGAVVAAVGVGALVLALRDDEPGETQPSVPPATTSLGRRPPTGFGAVQVLEPDGDIHLLTVDPVTGVDGTATAGAGTQDTEPAWDRSSNRLAFRRAEPSGSCTGICYVVPGNNAGDAGKQVAQLVPPRDGAVQHAPVWASPTEVVYAMTGGCDPGPRCAEEIRLATFDESADAAGFDDVLTRRDDVILLTGLEDVRDLALNPDEQLVVADGGGMTIADDAGQQRVGAAITDVRAVTYTPDGTILVGLGTFEGRSTLEFFGHDGVSLQTLDIAQTARTYTDSGATLGDLDVTSVAALSITPGGEGPTIDVLLDDASDATSPVLATIGIAADGSAGILDSGSFPVAILAAGLPQAIAR